MIRCISVFERNMIQSLRQRGFDDARTGRRSGLIIDTLRKALGAERSGRAETPFGWT